MTNKEEIQKKYCSGLDYCICAEIEPCIYRIANKLQEQLQDKEQECEELKKEKAEIKKYLGISDKAIIQRLEELQEFKDKLKISEYKLKQALDEIEKIIKQTCSRRCTNDCLGTRKHCGYGQIFNIINKIKEVFPYE